MVIDNGEIYKLNFRTKSKDKYVGEAHEVFMRFEIEENESIIVFDKNSRNTNSSKTKIMQIYADKIYTKVQTKGFRTASVILNKDLTPEICKNCKQYILCNKIAGEYTKHQDALYFIALSDVILNMQYECLSPLKEAKEKALKVYMEPLSDIEITKI